MKRVLVAIGCVFTLTLVGVACEDGPSAGRSLREVGTGTSTLEVSQRLGPVSLGFTGIENVDDANVTIRSATVVDPPDDLRILGVRLYRTAEQKLRAAEAYACGFPPRDLLTYPAKGFRLAAGETVFLAIGVEVLKRTGQQLSIKRISIAYEIPGEGRYQQIIKSGDEVVAKSDAPAGEPCK